jgi:hypothetical protein
MSARISDSVTCFLSGMLLDTKLNFHRFFFQKMNLYLAKNQETNLSEVLLIASYNIFPSFWQLMDCSVEEDMISFEAIHESNHFLIFS